MARMPEVGFAAAVSGRDNLHVLAQCRTVEELVAVSSERVGALPGVEAAEVSPIHRQVKQGGTPVEGDRLG
jgi:DNA-binding Lrp family transcriptional regulator